MTSIQYLSGFGNHFATEALKGTLPQGQNSPQQVNYGLYAEQLSGSAFTAPKNKNFRSWLYRIKPSVVQGSFTQVKHPYINNSSRESEPLAPNPWRWNPLPFPNTPTNFIEGMVSFASNGSIALNQGSTVHLYVCNKSMVDEFFYSADGELLIVPQQGSLLFRTEFGLLEVSPEEIMVIPRGVKFQVQLMDEAARGYICENHGQALCLPERGPIGANGLANERDFLYPTAFYEDIENSFNLSCKFQGSIWCSEISFSPLNVVAWHGNYAPYKYNLKTFNAINTVSYDHCDPSIFTVLTSASQTPGVANLDFVIFPERWQVAEHSFRPPYFHRNIMSELMGLIKGEYDAKAEGFIPGGVSIHNCMTPHGPDTKSFEIASKTKLKPQYIENTLAFMFESCFSWELTPFAQSTDLRQKSYHKCWQDFVKSFKKEK